MKSFIYVILLFLLSIKLTNAQNCNKCHQKETPAIISDWRSSKHFTSSVGCVDCHGNEHKTINDFNLAKIPTPKTCQICHKTQVEQFMIGKHSLAWSSMKEMPAFHKQQMAMTEGIKECSKCHKIGIKSTEEIRGLQIEGQNYGIASCDACHTRHTFSVKEAKQPQTCRTCHSGYDHDQWEIYSGSRHGIRYSLKQKGILPEDTAAPTCQTCHLHNGDHGVITGWGFLAARLPMPEDTIWAADRTTILKAIGVLDPTGKPTARMAVFKSADAVRLTREAWQTERNKTLEVICSQCHSNEYALQEVKKGDNMIKQADHLMAQAIELVAGLYQDDIIPKPFNYSYKYPDLLNFHNAPTLIEQKLYAMFFEHRMKTFQGAFHSNSDYTFWYGFGEMQRELNEINELAGQMRNNVNIIKNNK